MVYDLTRQDTLDKLPLWIEQLHNYSPEAQMYLVGNKNDLVNERVISFEAGEAAMEESTPMVKIIFDFNQKIIQH